MKKSGYDAKDCYVGRLNGKTMRFPTEQEYDDYIDDEEFDENEENDVDNTLNEC